MTSMHHAVSKYFTEEVCNKHWKLFLTVFYMVIEYKLQNQSSFNCMCGKNMLQNCRIDAHGCLSRLLTSPLTR